MWHDWLSLIEAPGFSVGDDPHEQAMVDIRMFNTATWKLKLDQKQPMRPFNEWQNSMLAFNMSQFPRVQFRAQQLSERGIIPWLDIVLVAPDPDDTHTPFTIDTASCRSTLIIHPLKLQKEDWREYLGSPSVPWQELGRVIWFVICGPWLPATSIRSTLEARPNLNKLVNFAATIHSDQPPKETLDLNLIVCWWQETEAVTLDFNAWQSKQPRTQVLACPWQFRQNRVWLIRPDADEVVIEEDELDTSTSIEMENQMTQIMDTITHQVQVQSFQIKWAWDTPDSKFTQVIDEVSAFSQKLDKLPIGDSDSQSDDQDSPTMPPKLSVNVLTTERAPNIDWVDTDRQGTIPQDNPSQDNPSQDEKASNQDPPAIPPDLPAPSDTTDSVETSTQDDKPSQDVNASTQNDSPSTQDEKASTQDVKPQDNPSTPEPVQQDHPTEYTPDLDASQSDSESNVSELLMLCSPKTQSTEASVSQTTIPTDVESEWSEVPPMGTNPAPSPDAKEEWLQWDEELPMVEWTAAQIEHLLQVAIGEIQLPMNWSSADWKTILPASVQSLLLDQGPYTITSGTRQLPVASITKFWVHAPVFSTQQWFQQCVRASIRLWDQIPRTPTRHHTFLIQWWQQHHPCHLDTKFTLSGTGVAPYMVCVLQLRVMYALLRHA